MARPVWTPTDAQRRRRGHAGHAPWVPRAPGARRPDGPRRGNDPRSASARRGGRSSPRPAHPASGFFTLSKRKGLPHPSASTRLFDWPSGTPLLLYPLPFERLWDSTVPPPRLHAMVNLTVASQRFNVEFAAGRQRRPARGTACRRPASAAPECRRRLQVRTRLAAGAEERRSWRQKIRHG
jgi:hypothetical protein